MATPNMTLLPERLLSKIDPADRKALGKAGKTMPEHMAEYSVKLERELHGQVNGFLRRHGLNKVIHANPAKRSTLPEGWPDYTIFHNGKVLFLELKVGNNTLSPIQEEVIADLIASGFRVLVLYTFTEVVAETLKYFNL